MPNTKPPRNLTPGLCQRLQREMLEACREVVARHGLAVDAKGLSNLDLRWGFDLAFRVSLPRSDGSTPDPERLWFEALAAAFGLSPADFGREFGTERETFRITGIDRRRPKYPVSAERLPDRQGFKFTAEQVAALLRAGMKDVTPRCGEARNKGSSLFGRLRSSASDCLPPCCDALAGPLFSSG